MREVLKPLPFGDLPVKPPFVGKPKVSEDLQQTVALLSGWDGSTRRLVRVSPTGVLSVASPPVKGIINLLANQASYNWQGGDISTTEVLVINHCKNTADVWVNVGAAADVDTGYLLECGDLIRFSINNLHTLHIHIVGDTERAIVVYTK